MSKKKPTNASKEATYRRLMSMDALVNAKLDQRMAEAMEVAQTVGDEILQAEIVHATFSYASNKQQKEHRDPLAYLRAFATMYGLMALYAAMARQEAQAAYDKED